jgi:hypothetical protein
MTALLRLLGSREKNNAGHDDIAGTAFAQLSQNDDVN